MGDTAREANAQGGRRDAPGASSTAWDKRYIEDRGIVHTQGAPYHP
jgi:hypothetical protein